jgi:HAD superfamily hydrolase (TIGR01490 family)
MEGGYPLAGGRATQRGMTQPPAIAFFDLDRTLLSVNSATLWVKRELRLGFISRWAALRGAMWLALYELGLAQMDDAIRTAIGTLADQSEDEIRGRTMAFWREELADSIRPGAHAVLAAHRSQGDQLVLLTSSSNYLSELAAEALGLDAILCNRFQVEQGRFTGKPVEPLCFAEGKHAHALAFAEAAGVPLSKCTFYTDSYSDISVLKAVGKAVVVHPDPRLKRAAERHAWAVENW